MKIKKTQSSIEFIILVSVLLLFLVSFLMIVQQNISDKMREQKDAGIRDVAVIVQDEINLAFKSGDGYFREFTIPEKILGESYELGTIPGRVYARTFDNRSSISLPIKDATGEIRIGQNTITKENNIIYING